ncbi:CoB--CoM heterodisulfide reductase iron-sulfur subunit A family protein [Chloroflexota bacterium]
MKNQEVKRNGGQRCTDVLVVGGGIAGITASLELAKLGHNVHLVERGPSIGGHMSELTKVFPTLDDAQSILAPKMDEVTGTKNVNLYNNAEIEAIQGQPGDFKVKVLVKPAGKDDDKEKAVDIDAGSIILATGYQLFDASKIREYGYGTHPDVITMLDLERITSASESTNGRLVRPSDNKEVKSIAIALCSGSRDGNRFIPYCSHICCMYSITQAISLREQFGVDVSVFYIDIRAAGRGYEELYWRAQDSGVDFIKGKVAEIRQSNGSVMVRAEDLLLAQIIEQEFDLVALAVPMVPAIGADELADKLELPLADDGFVEVKQRQLEPLNTQLPGIFVAGCASGPKDIRDSVADALGAAAKASAFLSKNGTN